MRWKVEEVIRRNYEVAGLEAKPTKVRDRVERVFSTQVKAGSQWISFRATLVAPGWYNVVYDGRRPNTDGELRSSCPFRMEKDEQLCKGKQKVYAYIRQVKDIKETGANYGKPTCIVGG